MRTGAARRALAAQRRAQHCAISWRQRARSARSHDQLGDLGQPVADPHQRHAPGQIGHGDAEHRRALELAQRSTSRSSSSARVDEPRMRCPVPASSSARGRQARRAGARRSARRAAAGARRSARREIRRARASSTSRRRALRVLVQQREIRRARADGLEHPQQPPQHAQGVAADRAPPRQPAPAAARRGAAAGLVEAPHRRRVAQVREQARGRVRLGVAVRRKRARRAPQDPARGSQAAAAPPAAVPAPRPAAPLVAARTRRRECARHALAMQCELGAAGCPSRRSPSPAPCARAPRRPAGSACVCRSAQHLQAILQAPQEQ